MIKTLLLSSLILNLSLLLGRLSGFGREVIVASTYGATADADVVVLMLTVPDLLVSILMGGALGAVMVPEFSQRPKVARKLLYQSLLLFGIIFICVTLILYWKTDMLVALLVPGFSEELAVRAADALKWVIWLIPLTVLAGVVTAYLHAQNKFFVPALGTLIINSSIIVGLLLVFFGLGTLQLVGGFVLLGGVLRLISQLLQVRPSLEPLAGLSPSQFNKSLLIRYLQAMMAGSILLLFPVVARALASYKGEGSVALFNYATRLVEFPLVIAVTFLVVLFFPRLAHSFTNNPVQHRNLIKYGVQITLGLSVLAAIALITLSNAFVEIVYGYGNMKDVMLDQVSTLVAIGLVFLPLQGLSVFLTAVFNARKNTRTPLILNTTGLVFFLLASNIGMFGEGLQALMWGLVASYGLICVLQLTFLKIDDFSWWRVLFEREFLTGIICAMFLSAYAVFRIEQADFSAWLSLLLAVFVSLLSLTVLSLFNDKLRTDLKLRLSIK